MTLSTMSVTHWQGVAVVIRFLVIIFLSIHIQKLMEMSHILKSLGQGGGGGGGSCPSMFFSN